MAKKLYGSLFNRLCENQGFENIQVGTHATEFLYSDRHAWEVVEVKDHKNITIRQLKATRIDNNGMSDCQEYKFASDENGMERKLTLRNGSWYRVNEYSIDQLKKNYKTNEMARDFKTEQNFVNYALAMSGLTQKQIENVRNGKTAKKLVKINISFGHAEEYHDYSF